MKTNSYFIRMRKEFFSIALGVLALLLLYTTAGGFGGDGSDKPAEAGLTRVEAKYVCMVNNQLYSKAQIPVIVDGKTYYGCCQMCKDMLKDNPEHRSAVDPVSGNVVDKAVSVIGSVPDGTVRYFESEENFRNFRPDTVVEK